MRQEGREQDDIALKMIQKYWLEPPRPKTVEGSIFGRAGAH